MTAAETGIRMTELTALERKKLGGELGPDHFAVSSRGTSYVIDVGADSEHKIGEALAAFVAAARTRRVDEADNFARLITAMTPPRTAGRGITVQAYRNAEARAALEGEFGLLTSSDVAKAANTKAKNTSALAGRWRQEGKIFSVPSGDGTHLYPGFQFDSTGRPLPVIAGIIEALAPTMDGWSLALWFVGTNGWLGGERPADVLHDDQVVNAAQQLAAEVE